MLVIIVIIIIISNIFFLKVLLLMYLELNYSESEYRAIIECFD